MTSLVTSRLLFIRLVALIALCLSYYGQSACAFESQESVAERQKRALAFADEHHPELGELLRRLEKKNATEFRFAIQDLDRTIFLLNRTKERQPERYPLELEAWQIDSRIRLLGARLSMGASDDLEQELREALKNRQRLRLELVESDRQRTLRRLQKLDEQAAYLRKSSDKIVEQELAKFRKSVRDLPKKQAAKKITGKPSAEKPSAPQKSKSPSKSEK